MAIYPTGVRPLLPAEAARRRSMERRLVEALEKAGFGEIILPIIDFEAPYAEIRGRDAARQRYRFVDREGELVAIRSDFTPMVARALAPSLGGETLPLRLFYRGDVIRCNGSRLGANREMFQIGAEIVGDASPEADLETLRLASTLVTLAGFEPLVVISAGTFPADAAAAAGIALQFDDLEEDPGYYSGLRFRIYCRPGGTLAGQGGRYDALYGLFGAAAPAVGFTLTIDDLAAGGGR
ncbi:MAG TPA: ATP phosphoribosyltransferase regulatory subunit [Thermoanaerobaculia bacterium]|nr:ATP phosphoribosyltransferase regulatory subunit [Thermoanaerobaculia bacterium]